MQLPATPKIGVIIHTPLRDQLFTPADQNRLNALGDVTWTTSPTPLKTEAASEILRDCQIAIGSWNTPFPNATIIESCPHLRLWEHVAGTVKGFFGPHLDGRDLTIASCKTALANSVAEMTLAQIIFGLRGLLPDAQLNRDTIQTGVLPDRNVAKKRARVLYGSTIGIIGASEVGKRVVNLLRPFGCRILLFDPFVKPEIAQKMGVELVENLADLCAACDVVSLHTPALPSTKNLVGARELQAMRDDAVFVNTSRGECVDESALIAELGRGRLFAFLDVTSPEPAAPNSPLRTLPNVQLNSHIAGPPAFSMGHQAVNDVEAWLNGQAPQCVITREMLEFTA